MTQRGDHITVHAAWAAGPLTGIVQDVTEWDGEEFCEVQLFGQPPSDTFIVRSFRPGEAYKPCSPPWGKKKP